MLSFRQLLSVGSKYWQIRTLLHCTVLCSYRLLIVSLVGKVEVIDEKLKMSKIAKKLCFSFCDKTKTMKSEENCACEGQ